MVGTLPARAGNTGVILGPGRKIPPASECLSVCGAAAAAAAELLQSCLTLCHPRDGNPRGCPVPGILQARTLEGYHHCTPHTLAPALCNKRGHRNEQRSLRPTPREKPLLSTPRESLHTAVETQCSQKRQMLGLSPACSKLPLCLDAAERIHPSELGNFISHFSAAGGG